MTGFGSLLQGPPRYGIGAAAVPQRADLPTYIRITDIDDDGNFSPDPAVSVDSKLSGNYVLRDGDLVVARTGASVGKSYRYRTTDGLLVFAGFLICVRPNAKALDPRWLGHYFHSAPYWNWVVSESMRSGQPGINAQQLAHLDPAPPSIADQQAVADALDDAETLISSLERLIAKKRDLKQGMMQELLTGRTRLPGFSDVWDEDVVGAIAEVKTGPFGSTLHESDYVDLGTPIITVEHLGEFGVVANNAPMVSNADRLRLKAYALAEGDIVFSRVGSIDRNARIAAEEAGWLFSGRLLRVRCNRRLADSSFMSQQFRTERFTELVRSVAVGQTMPSLNTAILRGIPIVLPPLAEQRAIGKDLSDVDAEIANLEQRIASARAVKVGMMQELLTGRTRLPVEGRAA